MTTVGQKIFYKLLFIYLFAKKCILGGAEGVCSKLLNLANSCNRKNVQKRQNILFQPVQNISFQFFHFEMFCFEFLSWNGISISNLDNWKKEGEKHSKRLNWKKQLNFFFSQLTNIVFVCVFFWLDENICLIWMNQTIFFNFLFGPWTKINYLLNSTNDLPYPSSQECILNIYVTNFNKCLQWRFQALA